jgi:hypothetical protein
MEVRVDGTNVGQRWRVTGIREGDTGGPKRVMLEFWVEFESGEHVPVHLPLSFDPELARRLGGYLIEMADHAEPGGAQTGLGDRLRAVMSQIEFYDMHGPYLELCAEAERLERERDEWRDVAQTNAEHHKRARAQIERVRAVADDLDRPRMWPNTSDWTARRGAMTQAAADIRAALDPEAGL